MNKKKQMVFNLNNFLLATSNVLDFQEKEFFDTTLLHSKKIAYIALKIGKQFNFSPEELSDLCSYCLVHNISMFTTQKKSKDYCEISSKIAEKLPFLVKKNEVLKYQCEFYDGSGLFAKKENETDIFSQIISFVDFLDTKFDFSKDDVKNRELINRFVKTNENKLFSKAIVDVYLLESSYISFWLDMKSENDILNYIFSNLHDFSMVLDFEEVLTITSIFTKIVNGNTDLLNLCEQACDYYKFDHKDKQTFLIAASLKDIGKLAINSKILNKNEKLNTFEYEDIKSYMYYTQKVLNNIMGFNDISAWASKAQETLDANGYPNRVMAKDLSFKDRLLAVICVYSSLVTNKPYRDANIHEKAIEIMSTFENKLDKAIIADINKILKFIEN